MILKAENVEKSFERASNNIAGIFDVNITIKKAEFHCIYGNSGSGKSTILNVLSGMLHPTAGKVYLDDEDLYKIKESERTKLRINTIGYIMQGASLLSNLTVYDNIVFSLGVAKIKIQTDLLNHVIEQMKLKQIIHSYPKELSGGEYRRVSVARTIISNPKIIIADEPTSNLDEENANIILDIFEKLYLQGTGIIVATHDQKFITENHIIHKIENGKLS